MSELTKDYFDKRLNQLVTRDDLKTELDKLVTKDDLKTQLEQCKKDIYEYVHEGFEVQQTYIDDRTKEIVDSLGVESRIKQIETDVVKIKRTIHIS